jgi:hypothetical protein
MELAQLAGLFKEKPKLPGAFKSKVKQQSPPCPNYESIRHSFLNKADSSMAQRW